MNLSKIKLNNFYLSFCLLAIPLPSQSALRDGDVVVRGGLVNISSFMQWKDESRLAYVMGLADGVRTAAIFNASGDQYERFLSCFSKINGNQLLAMTDKWINNNPESWNLYLNHEFISIAYKTCNLYKKSP